MDDSDSTMSDLLSKVFDLGTPFMKTVANQFAYGDEAAKQIAIREEILSYNARNGSGTASPAPKTFWEFMFGVPATATTASTQGYALPLLLIIAVVIFVYFLIRKF